MKITTAVMSLLGPRLRQGVRGAAVQRDYRELLEEIKEITTVDGFVSSCLEIKESMFFYERDLMLAAYTASLELLIVAALLNAGLRSKRDLVKAQAEVELSMESLLSDLTKFQFPLDIQYVVDRFLQGAAVRLRWRLNVYTQMMKVYASDQDYMQDDLDDILRGAHRLLHQETSEVEPRLAYLLGRAGAKMLREPAFGPCGCR